MQSVGRAGSRRPVHSCGCRRPFLALGKGFVSVWGWVLRTASASISRSSALVFAVGLDVGFHEVMGSIWGRGGRN